MGKSEPNDCDLPAMSQKVASGKEPGTNALYFHV
jgi:hypothetical protein